MKREERHPSRLEALIDSAFAFALTLLVIATGPPRSFDELAQALQTVPAFIASATLLLMFWQGHVEWSRRYGLDDAKSVVLSCVLIFTVMIYVYPLRLIASAFFHWITGGFLDANLTSFQLSDVRLMFLVYGCGFVAMCASLILLYRHAIAQAEKLGLDRLGLFDARVQAGSYMVLAAAGVVSVLICFLPGKWALQAGWAYLPLSFVMPWYGIKSGKKRRELEAVLAAAAEKPDEPPQP
jgi:uncharacterized membrane protein